MSKTIVIFRTDKDDVCFALFPEEPGSVGHPEQCLSYDSIGQHGSADYKYSISLSRPATRREKRNLKNALGACGYDNLEERYRGSYRQFLIRQRKLEVCA